MPGKLNRQCKKCGTDRWISIDNKENFIEVCDNCLDMVVYNKSELLKNFQCKNCSNTTGTLNDNDDNIEIVCSECKTSNIVLNKNYVESDNRNDSSEIIIKPSITEQPVKCPKCGSTQITAGQRGFSLITGFIGSNKTVNRCARCGYSWKPKL